MIATSTKAIVTWIVGLALLFILALAGLLFGGSLVLEWLTH